MKNLLILPAAMCISATLYAGGNEDFVFSKHVEERMIEDHINNKVYYVNDFTYDLSIDPEAHRADRYKSRILMNRIVGGSGISGLDEAYTGSAGARGGSGHSGSIEVCFKSLKSENIGYEIVWISSCPGFVDFDQEEHTLAPAGTLEVKILLKNILDMNQNTYKFLLSQEDSERIHFNIFKSEGLKIDCSHDKRVSTGNRCEVDLSSKNISQFEILTSIVPITSRIERRYSTANRIDYTERVRDYFGLTDVQGRLLQRKYAEFSEDELVNIFQRIIDNIWYE